MAVVANVLEEDATAEERDLQGLDVDVGAVCAPCVGPDGVRHKRREQAIEVEEEKNSPARVSWCSDRARQDDLQDAAYQQLEQVHPEVVHVSSRGMEAYVSARVCAPIEAPRRDQGRCYDCACHCGRLHSTGRPGKRQVRLLIVARDRACCRSSGRAVKRQADPEGNWPAATVSEVYVRWRGKRRDKGQGIYTVD